MAASIPNDNLTIPANWRGMAPVLIAVGAVCVLVSLGLFSLTGSEAQRDVGFRVFFHSYLANFMFCLSFCLGALFFVLVTHLVRASWGASIRRISELLAFTISWWALMFIPILAMVLFTNSQALYAWNGGLGSQLPLIVQNKLSYLNPGFFTIRTLVYFAIWGITARIYFSMSRKQDDTGDTEITLKLQRWAGPLIMLFALALNFAAFDWMMSTDAAWFSTIYGVYMFSAGMLSFFAVMIILCYMLQRSGRIEKLVTTEHYQDMSKFQHGFIVFWAYIAFSQYLLYWYGNIPEETLWYKVRMTDGWQYVGVMLIVFHFAVPFLGTMSRHVRRNRGVMAAWAGLILVAHWLDMTFLILPNAGLIHADLPSAAPLTPMLLLGHLVCWIGMVSIFLALLLLRAGETPLVATKDPWLPESLAYQVGP